MKAKATKPPTHRQRARIASLTRKRKYRLPRATTINATRTKHDAADLAPGETLGDDKADKILRRKSRSDRWNAAVNKAQLAKSELDDAFTELNEIKSEFEDWRDNTPENLHGSPLYEKLDAVCDLEFDRDSVMDLLDVIDEADGIDLPQGFGRD